jgi:hypothetical protein
MKAKNYVSGFLLFVFLTAHLSGNSAVLIVDNSSVSPGVYTTIAAAAVAASPGDTLYIQPSGLVYTGPTINKRLHIVGPSHTPVYTTTLPQINGVVFAAGSNGSVLEGVVVSSTVTINTDVRDITIRYCRFVSASAGNYITAATNNHNLVVEGNVFQNYGSAFGVIGLHPTSQNVLVKNNFFRITSSHTNPTIFTGTNSSTVFDHNTVIISQNGSYCSNCEAHRVSNNIWIGTANNISSGAGASQFFNNLTYSTTTTYADLPGEGNINNAQPVFENGTSPYAWSVNSDFSLAEASPGYTGSLGGNQIGMYGGGFDFRKRGQPSGIPTFDQVLLLNNTVPQNGTIQIRVRAQKGQE